MSAWHTIALPRGIKFLNHLLELLLADANAQLLGHSAKVTRGNIPLCAHCCHESGKKTVINLSAANDSLCSLCSRSVKVTMPRLFYGLTTSLSRESTLEPTVITHAIKAYYG